MCPTTLGSSGLRSILVSIGSVFCYASGTCVFRVLCGFQVIVSEDVCETKGIDPELCLPFAKMVEKGLHVDSHSARVLEFETGWETGRIEIL